MLDSPQDEENYEDILQAYMPDDELTPNENLEGSQGNMDQVLSSDYNENQDLGEVRVNTKYSLRVRPKRNKKYFHTTLRDGMLMEENVSISKPNKQIEKLQDDSVGTIKKTQRKGILKKFISQKKYTDLEELNKLYILELAQIRAIRQGYMVQKELKMLAKNTRLEDYLFKNEFLRGKQSIHNQDLQESYEVYRKKKGGKSCKTVQYQSGLKDN